ncbi:prolipoprotein diacylglyceryl transferase [Mesoplasma seiffertii]|uniref:prolipoprotein diacylglyceryl transferase n=1 Tax=Mesoplasma seiffertii TaxID=28224 RepID=UPI001B7F8131|nr:prolipoprotein diacylglyceryl transferase family protein [Mesoplasma seiffertii]
MSLMTNIGGWSLADWLDKFGDPANERLFFGVIPAYPVFMFSGILLTIIASIIHFKMKGIPLREFEWAVVLVVPLGVIGASIFGKAFIPGMPWWRIFFFWEPGMSLFGALFLGITAGFVLLYKRSKLTMISVWVYADCIIPNILLGQSLGRWGNLFNHEIMGTVVDYEDLSWLPDFIRNKLFYFPNLSEFKDSLGQGLPSNWFDNSEIWGSYSNGEVSLATFLNETKLEFRQPLFLYEAMANFGLWVIITFFIANLSRFFNKPKPWDLEPTAYPGWFNKHYKSIVEDQLTTKSTLVPIKYKQVRLTGENGEIIELKLSFWKAWNKAYYWYEPDSLVVAEFENKAQERSTRRYQGEQRILQLKSQYKIKAKQTKNSVKKAEYKESYILKRNEIYAQIGKWSRRFNINPDARALEKLNNPHNFFIIRSGVISGSYIFGYLLIRIILETYRKPQEYFIQNMPGLNFTVLAFLLLVGIAVIVIAQFIAPYKWREVGWLYEKSY